MADENAVVVSRELALKLFNKTDVTGKSIEWIHDEYGGIYKISGVFATPSANATIQFDAAFNIKKFLEENDDLEDWQNSDPFTYVALKPHSDPRLFIEKIRDFLQSKNNDLKSTLLAQQFSDRYLYGTYENGQAVGGRIDYVRLFSVIALFILIIACVNFMNMTTAKAAVRIKEVGVKKVMGANRKNLFAQYLTESTLFAFLSLAMSFALVGFILPLFSEMTGKRIILDFSPSIIFGVLGLTLLTGLVSGSYPALYLSGFSPASILKGKGSQRMGKQLVRTGLVVFQFAVSAILVVAVMVVYQQVELIQSKNLGYNKEQIIQFRLGIQETAREEGGGMSEADIDDFLKNIKNVPGVKNASNYAYFMDDYGTTTGLEWPGKDPGKNILFGNIAAGYDFIETLQIKMQEGRAYSRKYSTDKEKIIFNETAIREMGLEDPIGKVVKLWGEEREIIGIMEDFHFAQLYEKIGPLFINLTTGDFASNVLLKMEAGNEVATIDRVKKVYQDYFITGLPLDFFFMDEQYNRLYAQEILVGKLSRYAAGTAIFIACLGLFGFATFTVQRRLKEMAIRKVLGSSEVNIIKLLLRAFLVPVLLAFLVAIPISYFIAGNYLNAFAFHVEVSVWHFVITGLFLLLVTLMTVGLQLGKVTGLKMAKYVKGKG